MTDKTQPEALRLAEQYDYGDPVAYSNIWRAAVCTELRRLHAENERLSRLCDKWNGECDEFREDNKRLAALVEAQQHARIAELEAQLEAVGAGGVQALSAAQAVLHEPTNEMYRAAQKIALPYDDDGGTIILNTSQIRAIWHSMLAASPTPPAEQKACDTQLFEFYGVSTTAELIAAQARHIEKLQAKLPPTPSFAPQRVREG